MIKKMKGSACRLSAAILACGLLLAGTAVAGSHSNPDAPAMDIVDTAASAGTFTKLVEAVKAAGLVGTLKGEGPYTVFAPSDEAFGKLPAGTLESLLNDKEKLTAVLTYHVVPGRHMASDVVKMTSATTAQGQQLTIDASDGVKVNSARVVKTDIVASNGVIHVIDEVVLPR